MPFSDFQTYWLVTAHDRDAPDTWKEYLPVGCRFTFAQTADGEYHYVPGPGTRGPCAMLAVAVLSGNKVIARFAPPVGDIVLSIRGLGRHRQAITLAPPGPHPAAIDHGGAHGIDD